MVFWINVPIIALALLLGLFLVPNSRDEQRRPMDPLGALLSVFGLGSILYAIIEAPTHGWMSNETLGVAALGVLLMIAFVRWERRVEHPLLPMGLFGDRGFTIGLIAIMFAFFVMFSFMFTQMLHFQLVRDKTALEAAIRFLPLPLGLGPVAANSDRLVERFGSRNVVTTGLVLVSLGMALFTTVDVGTAYPVIGATFLLLGVGMGLTMAPSTTLVMDAVPDDKAGVGSATNDASREIGGALGIAIGGSVLNEYYQRSMSIPEGLEHLGSVPLESFPAAMRIGGEMLAEGNMAGLELIEAARASFVEGMVASAMVGGAIALATAFVVRAYMPGRD
jgi:MFS family permease